LLRRVSKKFYELQINDCHEKLNQQHSYLAEYDGLRIKNERTDGAVNSPVENAAGVGRRRVSEVLHDQGAVPEDVDHVAHVNLTHFRHLLTLLVGGSGAGRLNIGSKTIYQSKIGINTSMKS
jgi:hypothetical protein